MEQYLIQLPKKIAVEIRKQIASSDKNDKKTKIDMISGGWCLINLYWKRLLIDGFSS
jgi:hypothetical protein